MAKGIFLTAKDLMTLEGVNSVNAWRSLRTIKDSMGKTENQKVTMKEYAKYRGIDEAEVKQALNL
jgi:hypothetical protein